MLAEEEVRIESGCDTCHASGSFLRPFSESQGGFQLQNGDRSRTPTAAGAGCCLFKHVWAEDGKPVLDRCAAYDFVPQTCTIALDDGIGTTAIGSYTWIGDDSHPAVHSSASAIAKQLVREHLPGLAGDELRRKELEVEKSV